MQRWKTTIDDLPRAVSSWNRGRKWQIFQEKFPLRPEAKILDVGFSPPEYQAADNYLEKHYPWPHMITALTIEDPGNAEERYPGITVVRYDGQTMPFEDDEFDLVWSNAVIEHVGPYTSQVDFLREIDRVGRKHFVTTPNRWFPIEVHTRTPLLHWLPTDTFDKYLQWAGKSWAADDYMWLLSAPKFTRALKDAGIQAELLRNRLAGPALDFVAIW